MWSFDGGACTVLALWYIMLSKLENLLQVLIQVLQLHCVLYTLFWSLGCMCMGRGFDHSCASLFVFYPFTQVAFIF